MAVSGSMAPRIEVSVGPIDLIAFTSAMFETAVAGIASPRMLPHVRESSTQCSPEVKLPVTANSAAPMAMTSSVRVVDSTCAARLLRTPMM